MNRRALIGAAAVVVLAVAGTVLWGVKKSRDLESSAASSATQATRYLREAAAFAAQVDASGPRLPYSAAAREVLGIDASYGRLVDPLLELRETIMIARAVREHCVRAIDEGFAYGETALGGPLGLLLELRELGVATSPDLVDGRRSARRVPRGDQDPRPELRDAHRRLEPDPGVAAGDQDHSVFHLHRATVRGGGPAESPRPST